MLRITVLQDARGSVFKLEGKLTDEWVAETEKAWKAFSNLRPKEEAIVDLFSVSFVDEPGEELLARMHSIGAKLTGSGPMISAIIEKICGQNQSGLQGKLRRLLGILFLQLLVAASLVNGFRKEPANIPTNCGNQPFQTLQSTQTTLDTAAHRSRPVAFMKGLAR